MGRIWPDQRGAAHPQRHLPGGLISEIANPCPQLITYFLSKERASLNNHNSNNNTHKTHNRHHHYISPHGIHLHHAGYAPQAKGEYAHLLTNSTPLKIGQPTGLQTGLDSDLCLDQ